MIGSDWTDPIPAFILVVPRLQAALDEVAASPFRRLTLVVAPAGFGKTTLLRTWSDSAAGSDRTIVLVDTTHPQGMAYPVVRQLQGEGAIAPLISTLVDALIANADASVIDRMRADLFGRVSRLDGPCVVLIDDLDHLTVAVRGILLEGLLAHPETPANLAIVAAGRLPTHHALGRLATSGSLRQLLARDLVLTTSEARDLLALRGTGEVTASRVEAVMMATLGWPAGVALAGHLIGHEEEPEQWLPLDDYVATKILDAVGEPTGALLLAAADLPWLDRDLWQHLADSVEGAVAPFDTVRAIVPMRQGDERSARFRTYQMPPLLRSSLWRLRYEDGRAGGVDAEAVAEAAASWFAAHDLLHEVVALANETGRWATALSALVDPCRELAVRDDHTAIIALLSALPDAQLLAHDDVAFWYLLSLFSVGDVSEATRLHPRLVEAWRGTQQPLRRGRLAVLSTLLAIWNGDREHALACALEALSILPDDAHHERLRAAASAEVLSTHLGERETATAMFLAARAASEHLPWDQRWWATFVLPNQADRMALEGNLTAASKLFQHLIDSFSGVFPDQMALMHMRLALIDLERGRRRRPCGAWTASARSRR